MQIFIQGISLQKNSTIQTINDLKKNRFNKEFVGAAIILTRIPERIDSDHTDPEGFRKEK